MQFNGVETTMLAKTLATKSTIFSLLILLFFSLSSFATENTSSVANKFQVFYVEDTNANLSIDQIIKLPQAMLAQSDYLGHAPDSLDFSIWYQIRLKPEFEDGISAPFSITIDNPTLDYIDFYLVRNEKVLFKKPLGDKQQTLSELDHLVPKLTIYDEFGATDIIYVNVKTNGASGTPLIIEYETESAVRSSAQLMLIGCFLGVVVIMLIYNYFMYRGTKDPSFIHYMGYIFFAGTTLSLINGFIFYLFPFSIASWLNSHLMFSHFLGLTFALLFAVSFLRFGRVQPWFVKLGKYLAALNVMFALSAFFLTEATLTPIYFISVGVVYLFAITLMTMVFNTKKLWVKYYLFSWIPLFIGVGVGIAAFNGAIPYNFITRNGALLGVLAEICIMAIALLDRFRANEVEREYRLHHDEVTGLPNKVMLQKALQELAKGRKPFTLALFDVPETKELIPSLGVEAASKFTKKLFNNIENYAESLSSAYQFERKNDEKAYHVARVTDSSFAIILIGDLRDEALTYSMISIKEAVSSVIEINSALISASCYAGVVSYPTDTHEKNNLLSLAYQALVGGKKSEMGWERFQIEKSNMVQERFNLAADLQVAIDMDELEVYHQPQVDIATGDVKGSEILLRWHHSEFGNIPAPEIISIAEETGIINQLTEWIIDKGLSQQAKLSRLGFNHSVSINISQKDLNANGLIAHILTTSAQYKIDPEDIIFEITESATVDDPELANKVVTELHQQGYRIAIDDFGTGYSSLGYLSKLPFHEVKIDKGFMDITSSERNRTITEVTINLANRLGVEVVAEGVESEEVLEMLGTFKCSTAQGYLYSKPLSFIDYMRWLQANTRQQRDVG